MTPQPEIRIGDAEREAAVSALGEHYAAGRLTKEEYDERAEQAFAARTRSQLLPLFADLPRPQGSFAATGGPTRPAPGHAPRGPVRQRWWFGARLVPVLLVVGVLVVLTHLPWFLLLLVAWILFAKLTGRWSHRHHYHGHGPGWGPRNRTWG
jgi:Domain of unknown function (DUF1707)